MSGKPIAYIASLLGCSLVAAWTLPLAAQQPTPAARQLARETTADLIEEEDAPEDFNVYPATAMQPAPAAPAMSTRGAAAAPSRSSARPAMNRLASAPDMFGDFFMSGGNLNFGRAQGVPGAETFGSFTVPSAGGSRRVKIAENNKAMPSDRLIFSYSHFENALQYTETPLANPAAGVTRSVPIDRYTIGIEKMFLDGLWSCEVRMPFQGQFDFQSAAVVGDGGQVGNLAVILKRLLVEDEDFAVVVGMGIDVPTGSDFKFDDRSTTPLNPTRFTFHNDSLHLLPYTGFLFAGDERPYFINAFAQVDVATNGNRVEAGRVNGPSRILGTYTEQNLMFLDLGSGWWLYRDGGGTLTNLAALLEFHYTTSLQDTDAIAATVGGRPIDYRNNFNRFDIVNLTTGVQARLWDNTSVRVAGVFPLGSRDDQRFFDSELQVQINRQF
ncbi:hypothetical protein [Anatilimnocola floriformis]|uniref:hypothetical protein n=1 Tax=Anatilimnocola floriformis TaxID=2948575 RepID=UPI0020C3EAA6|nr:hypothetical protein [Anatilimnocola floriformis]